MICPLCRTKWKETSPSDELSNSQSQSATTVPNNTRTSSPSRAGEQDGDDNGNREDNVCVVANQVERWTEVSDLHVLYFKMAALSWCYSSCSHVV